MEPEFSRFYLSSVESFRRRSSSPKAKKGSKRVKFRSRDSVKTQSRYQQKRTNVMKGHIIAIEIRDVF